MLDTLEQIEPYTSYRFALALVLAGITAYWVFTSIGALRSLRLFVAEMNRQVNEQRLFNEVRLRLDRRFDLDALPLLRAKPGRIIKLALLSASLRLLGWRSLLRVSHYLLAIAILLPACGVAYWFAFTL
jgi:hypothetical protein